MGAHNNIIMVLCSGIGQPNWIGILPMLLVLKTNTSYLKIKKIPTFKSTFPVISHGANAKSASLQHYELCSYYFAMQTARIWLARLKLHNLPSKEGHFHIACTSTRDCDQSRVARPFTKKRGRNLETCPSWTCSAGMHYCGRCHVLHGNSGLW